MLSYALAIAVAISSLVIFSTAFLMSKIHRQDDFLWSGVGLFYAVVLWYCARNITGTVLLGQAAATVLVVSYSWQTIKLRRIIANPASANESSNFSVLDRIKGLLKGKKPQFKSNAAPVEKAPPAVVTEENIAIPETPAEISPKTSETNIDTNTPVANNRVQVQDSSPTPDIKNDPDPQTSKSIATESQPLPNKLPEVTNTATNKPEEIEQSTKEAKATANKETETATPDVSTNSIPEPPVEPISETVTPEVREGSSKFDTLETVEVAEVLEAESDNDSNQRNLDQSNIIEVATTEIDTSSEAKKTDQNQ